MIVVVGITSSNSDSDHSSNSNSNHRRSSLVLFVVLCAFPHARAMGRVSRAQSLRSCKLVLVVVVVVAVIIIVPWFGVVNPLPCCGCMNSRVARQPVRNTG